MVGEWEGGGRRVGGGKAGQSSDNFKCTAREKLMWVKSIGLPLTLNHVFFVFKFKGTLSYKFNKTCFSV